MNYYIDSHCHLNFKAFNSGWREVADRAFASGVKGIINVGSNLETSQRAVEIASQTFPLNKGEHKGVNGKLFAAIGLHPIHVTDEKFDASKYQNLVTNCHSEQSEESVARSSNHQSPITNHHPIVAIGETGIDLHHSKSTLVKQQEVFIESIYLANKNHLPIIIHNRNAKNEVLDILKNHPLKFGGVVHCFSEDWRYAQKILELGLYISLTGTITLNNISNDVLEVVEKAPLNKILIETDSPYIVPRRQKNKKIKRNEPAFIVEVAKRIAEIKNINLDEVAHQTTNNAIELFRLSF